MKRKKRKGSILVVLTLIVTMLFASVPVSAAGFDLTGSVVDGSLLTEESTVQDQVSVLTRGNILADGIVQLANLGDRVLGVSGTTNCHRICDQVICNVYLEQLDEETGDWDPYESWNSNDTNVYAHTVYYEYRVEGGHWYRLSGAHIAIKGTTVESISTTTDGIWID